ncbi:hypothetical protein IBA8401_10600 [Pseudomonas syringae]
MQIDDGGHYRETEAKTALLGAGFAAIEALEDSGALGDGDARPGILYFDARRGAAWGRVGADFDDSAAGGELDCVAQQVGQCFEQQARSPTSVGNVSCRSSIRVIWSSSASGR